jgi:hypothetical protein
VAVPDPDCVQARVTPCEITCAETLIDKHNSNNRIRFTMLLYFETGEGSQCATTTASGANIAAAVAWFIQNAATAGVAALASVVSSSTAVGKYAAYFFMTISPWNSVLLMSIGKLQ